MKFYVVSDLHLDIHGIRRDFWHDFDKEATLVVAGDTANGLSGISYVKNVLCRHFKAVIMIAGNHEWYSNTSKSYRYKSECESSTNSGSLNVSKSSVLAKLKAHSDTTENLFFLNNESIELDGYTIFGGTLWFPIHTYSFELVNAYSELMNDTKFIGSSMIEEQHKAFINNFPEKVDLAISHHLPSKEAFAFEQNASSDYAPYYHAGLSNELISRARYWVAGHQHDAVEKVIADGSTTFISNPKGSVRLTSGLLTNKAYYL
ncbi:MULTISPECIES: metallophosphoesterase [Vibrio harveyi group]|uniref:metallophosphoesterase n=1 Tax=Vibrio harveyi group TaxID=717610 RepID=UPI000E02C475|nr:MULTISPECIES: metallophosphoesterase [Vibrio harveyi group]EHK0039079.1 metallophosphoesterase [Vibrio parahaemolyticus]EHK2924263.1 metallophosphoesterase [Vibrio parahaemolyticus]ELB2044512.1 metallophosphoesterase [Vibrio parahaemolyticus]MDF5700818.1 metallophosphoesterase [Vibrio parahaemolyticus]MDG2794026.1 metallophosphoesterase [Vibrio parahaemolyticus]